MNPTPVSSLQFQRVSRRYLETILSWLEEPHVQAFWDNSPAQRQDIRIFAEGRQKPSPYWNGLFTYWVGLFNHDPYCLLMTSEILASGSDLPESWKPYLSKAGKTLGLDFMIGNTNYLGCGMGATTLLAFTEFMKTAVDPSIDTYIIDPAESNARAIHVYQKAGFRTVTPFLRDFGEAKDVRHLLMIKNIES